MQTLTFFETLDDLKKAVHALSKEGTTFQDYCNVREFVLNEKTLIIGMLEKLTKDKLKEYYRPMHSGDVKKDRMVRGAYENFLGFLSLDAMVSYTMGGSYEESAIKECLKVTEEQFNGWQSSEIQERAKHQKALSNPETLAEFETFVSYRSIGALTSEQLARFDSLRADKGREQKIKALEQKAQLSAVNLEGLEFSLHNSHHAKKNIPLWVVQLNGRVEREIYKELDMKAKALNGYYSSFRGNGAIPGFTFDNEDNAKAFMRLRSENVDASEQAKERIADRALNRIETLTEKGEGLEALATTELNKDRKDNTARRARMAASAEASAMADMEFAKTMMVISEGLQAGTVKYLDRLQNYTELETLYSILSSAKHRYIKAKEIKSDDFEWVPDVCDFARFPFPVIHIENVERLLPRFLEASEKVLTARRITKNLQVFKKKFPDKWLMAFVGPRGISDFKTLFCNPYSKVVDKYERKTYQEEILQYERMVRLGLDQPHELRAALRELVTVRAQATIDPEVKRARQLKEIDRQFIDVKIEGFFPTPKDLAREVVAKADLQPGQVVGEFSAGLGHLATSILEECPEIELHLMEINHRLCDALRIKGFENVTHGDFLECKPSAIYDRIVINPPFENLQDIDHVMHAWEFLKPGGRLVAIMAGNKEGNNKKTQGFRQFIDEYGSIESNEQGAFLSGFRPTSVNTVTIVLDKR
jgi:phospholipid N-methyltransferase